MAELCIGSFNSQDDTVIEEGKTKFAKTLKLVIISGNVSFQF